MVMVGCLQALFVFVCGFGCLGKGVDVAFPLPALYLSISISVFLSLHPFVRPKKITANMPIAKDHTKNNPKRRQYHIDTFWSAPRNCQRTSFTLYKHTILY